MTPAGYPSEQYHCLLDEQPYYLVPARLFGGERPDPLIVNPHAWFSWHGPLPPDRAFRQSGTDSLLPAEHVVWVEDTGTRALWPYWVGPDFLNYLGQLAPGAPVTIELPPLVRWVLIMADVLVEPGYPEWHRRQWLDSARGGGEVFRRGYTSVTGLVPPFHLGALRRYCRYHIRSGSWPMGDDQVARRYVAHNEPVAQFFHHQLANAVSDIAGTIVWPSYSYVAGYESGAVLDAHLDREQCEYSISMCIDASPEPSAQSSWPIQLDIPDGSLRVWQHLGDSLLYRGRQLTHYRDELSAGCTSTSLLFHYVDAGYPGDLS
jgi:hypothetical protein